MTTHSTRGTIAASAFFLAVLVFVAGCRTTPPVEPVPIEAQRIIGYVVGWKPIEIEDPRRLTHINYAFAQVSDEGEIVFANNEDAPQHLAQLNAMKQQNPDLKILVSVGGWGADGFSDAAFTQEARERFARSGVALIQQHGIDGIDLDWEYPGQPGPGIKHRPEDKQNFTLMLAELRAQLDALSDEQGRTGNDRYTLTIASTDGVYFEHTEMDRLHHHLDWINIMTYDFFGPWSDITGHHTGLYRSDNPDAPDRSSAASVQRHLDEGIPADKLVLGVAFYGRGWTGVNPEQNGLHQPYERATGSYAYSVLKDEYIDQRGFERMWDDAAKAPYLWSADSTTFITYDDPESLQHKAEFVRARGLGGVMFWEHAHDRDEELLRALNQHLRPAS